MIHKFPGIDNQVRAGIMLRRKYFVPNICHHKTSLWMSKGEFNPDFEFWHDIPPFLPPISICKQALWEYFHVAIHDCGLSHLEFHPIIYRLSSCKERQRWYAFLARVSSLVDRESLEISSQVQGFKVGVTRHISRRSCGRILARDEERDTSIFILFSWNHDFIIFTLKRFLALFKVLIFVLLIIGVAAGAQG